MKQFVIINDELRLGDVEDVKELIGDSNDTDVKSKGLWRVNYYKKIVYFFGAVEPSNIEVFKDIKNRGFYSPSIKGFTWLFSELNEPIVYEIV